MELDLTSPALLNVDFSVNTIVQKICCISFRACHCFTDITFIVCVFFALQEQSLMTSACPAVLHWISVRANTTAKCTTLDSLTRTAVNPGMFIHYSGAKSDTKHGTKRCQNFAIKLKYVNFSICCVVYVQLQRKSLPSSCICVLHILPAATEMKVLLPPHSWQSTLKLMVPLRFFLIN